MVQHQKNPSGKELEMAGRRLWIFGDSYFDPWFCHMNFDGKRTWDWIEGDYKKEKVVPYERKDLPEQYLACHNRAMTGSGPKQGLRRLLEVLSKYNTKNDDVIFGISHIDRFPVSYLNDKNSCDLLLLDNSEENRKQRDWVRSTHKATWRAMKANSKGALWLADNHFFTVEHLSEPYHVVGSLYALKEHFRKMLVWDIFGLLGNPRRPHMTANGKLVRHDAWEQRFRPGYKKMLDFYKQSTDSWHFESYPLMTLSCYNDVEYTPEYNYRGENKVEIIKDMRQNHMGVELTKSIGLEMNKFFGGKKFNIDNIVSPVKREQIKKVMIIEKFPTRRWEDHVTN